LGERIQNNTDIRLILTSLKKY